MNSKAKSEFILTESLRYIPKDPVTLRKHIEELKDRVKNAQDISEYVRLQGEIGVYLRSLDLFEEAQTVLQHVIDIIAKNKLGLRKEIQNKIRLAHVFQEAKKFQQSNLLFSEVVQTCRSIEEASPLLHFALQHAGKNEFDQGKYAEALENFEEALSLRQAQSAPSDQIQSTQAAIARTKQLMEYKV